MKSIIIFFGVSVFVSLVFTFAAYIYILIKSSKEKKQIDEKLNLNNSDIIEYKLDMACERTSNHILTESSISIYDKLDNGAKGFGRYVHSNNYNLAKVCRRIH